MPHPARTRSLPLPLSLIHISEPTRLLSISYAVFCLKKKKKFLDGAKDVTRLQQVGIEGMPEGVASHMLDDSCSADGLLHCALNKGLVDVMPPLFPSSAVLPVVVLGIDL